MSTSRGWNRPAGQTLAPTQRRHAGRVVGILLLLGMALAGLVVWFACSPGPTGGQKVDQSELSSRPKRANGAAKSNDPNIPPAKRHELPEGRQVAGAEQSQAADDTRPEQVTSNETAQADKPKDRRAFKNMMDQLLSMLTPPAPGVGVPPLPISDDMKFSEEQERKMLEQLVAEDEDSDETLQRKGLVQAMRDEYFALKKDHGWTFVQYLRALQAKVSLDAEVMHESLKINETVFSDPNVTDAEYKETLGKINKVLSDRGMPPLLPTLSGHEEDEDGNVIPANPAQ